MLKKIVATFSLLTVLGGIVAPMASAGEAFVDNYDYKIKSKTTTKLRLRSKDWMKGKRIYYSKASKIYQDGDLKITAEKKNGKLVIKKDYDDLTTHTANSGEFGYEKYGSKSTVRGRIKTVEREKGWGHRSTAGVN